MNIDELTGDFIKDGIRKNYYPDSFEDNSERAWSDRFKERIKDDIESTEKCYAEDDEIELLEEFRNDEDIQDIKRFINDDLSIMDYNDYDDFYNLLNGHSDIDDIAKEWEYHERMMKKIEKAAAVFSDIIRQFPENMDYQIDFSQKSVSIYLKVNVAPIRDNRELFGIGYRWRDCYEDRYNEFELEKMNELCIRMSDHDFGGNEFVSYYEDCINYVFDF